MRDFKKHALALAAGAMFAAPVYAQVSGEGIIYQIDQTNAQANINQAVNDALPQAAAVLQIDSTGTGNTGTNNIGTVIQGTVTGAFANVVIDPTGSTATNTATGNFSGLAGSADVIAPIIPDLSAYTDTLTGAAPFLYTITGTASNNYGLVLQNGQFESQAIVIQGTSAEVDAAAVAQDSLANANLVANGDTVTNSAFATGTLAFIGSDYNDPAGQNSVTVTYTGGNITITNSSGTIDFSAIGAGFAEPANTEGNLAFVTQGTDLSFFTDVNAGASGSSPSQPGAATDSFAGANTPTNNEALAIQDTVESYISIGQQGSLNTAIAIQNNAGGGNEGQDAAEIYQYEDAAGNFGSPTNEYALVAQLGNFNLAQVYQAGQFNSSYTYQLGDGNTAEVDQALAGTAGGAVAFIYQSNAAAGGAVNTGNYASVYQHTAGL